MDEKLLIFFNICLILGRAMVGPAGLQLNAPDAAGVPPRPCHGDTGAPHHL